MAIDIDMIVFNHIFSEIFGNDENLGNSFELKMLVLQKILSVAVSKTNAMEGKYSL